MESISRFITQKLKLKVNEAKSAVARPPRAFAANVNITIIRIANEAVAPVLKVGPFSVVDWYGTPYTQALHVVERYRLLDYEAAKAGEERGAKDNIPFPVTDQGLVRDLDYRGKGLQLHFTVEDDGVFTTPWSATVTYWRPLSIFGQWPEFVCADNPREAGWVRHVPQADKPDF